MAEILIKGMEMPKDCEACVLHDFFIDSYGDRWPVCLGLKNEDDSYVDIDLEERHPDCPLVEVPTHGDLVNRKDVLDAMNEEIVPKGVFLSDIYKALDVVPIVIEASKETEAR